MTAVKVNGVPVSFKIDTGADVTAVPKREYREILLSKLKYACGVRERHS